MTSLNEYTDEQLNYYRICCVTTDILAEGLRVIFKQEWDKLYKTTTGEWKRSSFGNYEKRKQWEMGLYNAILRHPFL